MRKRTFLLALIGLMVLGINWVGRPPAVSLAGGEDCLSYDPNALYVVADSGGWLLTDGVSRMEFFTNQSDANLALQVAQLYTQHCFIGRGNTRPDRATYIFEYWKGSSGLSGSLPTNDCIPYDKNALYITDEGTDWLLTDGGSRIKVFDNQSDAQAGLDLLRQYDQVCYIGRGTGRVMTYLYVNVYQVVPGVIQVVPGVIQVAPGVVMAAAEDCIPYNPSALYIVNEGSDWLLTDGSSRMEVFDNQHDAQLGLQVAQAHTEQCFVGRNNTRANRDDYVWEYWQGDSGLGITVPDEDCLSHDPSALTIQDQGANGWLLMGGPEAIQLFDTQADAQAALNVMSNYDQHCYIGRDNTRPDRKTYIMSYLRNSAVLGPPPVIPSSGPDCITYDPYSLIFNDQGAIGWILTDGTSNMLLLDNQADAQIAANVAIAHTQQCFIGRNNTRPDRYSYIFEYWQGDSGMAVAAPTNDCVSYDPANVTVTDGGANGWYVMDGTHSMLLLDNQTDAEAARSVLSGYNRLCFIGRNNTRSDRSRYIHTYLTNASTSGTTVTPVPTATTVLPPCASAPPPRMIVNHIGRVTYTTGEPVRVRNGPSVGNSILTLLPEGVIFYVTGGPVCGDPYWWWSVQTNTGLAGWMAEGVVGNYFIEPFGSP